MNTHVPGFQLFSVFLHHFVLAGLAISRVKRHAVSLAGLTVDVKAL